MICGIGYVSGVRVMVVASDSGIDAGAFQVLGAEKMLRAQAIALENKLPFVHLVESAGANLLKYRVEFFIGGGALFYNLARLSAAGIPVVTVVHGSSTAGGAYMPGLSDYVVMVRGRAKAFLAGPPLLKAATGEIATDEELGGAEMHTHVSGLGEYLAEDDSDALRMAREVVGRLGWGAAQPPAGKPPRYPAEELLGIMPEDYRKPVDMREVIARFADDSDFLEFEPDYGPATVCGHAAVQGMPVGIVTNNGPLDPAGSNKATHFIQTCCQAGLPILYLQNTTGYIVGKASEEAGMIKHGSKMIQAVSNATVPQITIMCGASFGAGNYGMCGRAFRPRFLFSWPNAQTAVMGAEQAAAHHGDRHRGRHAAQRPGRGHGADRRGQARDRGELRAPAERVRHQRAHARRRRDRPARHPQRAGVCAFDLPRGGCAHSCGRCSSGSRGRDYARPQGIVRLHMYQIRGETPCTTGLIGGFREAGI